VYMLDIDENMLKEAFEEVKNASPNAFVQIEVVDVADFDAMQAVAKKLFDNGGNCNF